MSLDPSAKHPGSPGSFAVSNRKIDPTRRRSTRPDGSPDDNDRVETGPTRRAFEEWAALGLEAPNLERMRETRLARLRSELRRQDLAGLLMFDPLNIRYATDSSNMQLWTTHNFARAAYVATEGPVILWDFHGSDHLTAHLPLIDEVRHGAGFFYFITAERTAERAGAFAAEVEALMRAHSGRNRRLAVDKIEIAGLQALERLGVEAHDGQRVTELARVIKGVDEIKAMRCAMAACEAACLEMRDAISGRVAPGLAEVDLWAIMQHGNFIRGGEWVETRILSTGPRTNPWFQECGPREFSAGEMLSFDTDLIGPYGYCADISRSWLIGDGEATKEQKRIHRMAHEHIMTNAAMLKPGVSFRELTFGGHQLPEEFAEQRYSVRFHGVGLCDEYPDIRYPQDFIEGAWPEEYSYLQPGMTLCAEAYVGAVGGREGVKLEDQWLITETGAENLTKLAFDERLL